MSKIYLQTHNVDLWGLPSSSGEEGGIYTNKSWIEKADNWGLIFLITTGTYQEYYEAGFEQDIPETTSSSKRIYFLWEKFEVERVEQCSNGEFYVAGSNRHQIFNPPVLLNDTLGFDEFRRRYLTSGLINLAKNSPPYLQTLLTLSNESMQKTTCS